MLVDNVYLRFLFEYLHGFLIWFCNIMKNQWKNLLWLVKKRLRLEKNISESKISHNKNQANRKLQNYWIKMGLGMLNYKSELKPSFMFSDFCEKSDILTFMQLKSSCRKLFSNKSKFTQILPF